MVIEPVKGKAHLVIKRDGREEPYQDEKMLKILLWATDGKANIANTILQDTQIKIHNRIAVDTLFDSVIDTTVAKISPMYPLYDTVARNLLLVKYHKNTYAMPSCSYPDYKAVVRKGITSGVYSREVFESFTPEELDALGAAIDPSYDNLFSYKGLYLHFNKYCLKASKTKHLELPQHSYMRSAIFKFYRDDNRIERIIQEYTDQARHLKTRSTPDANNSGTPRPQIASCVLNTMADDTNSITDTLKNIAHYSKFGGGIAIDMSLIRASGAVVEGNQGQSSGPIPFIKAVESVITSFDQGGKRKGSAVITYPFWHYNVENMLPLKDNGGAEEHRARHLMYAIRIHDLLKDRVIADAEITLFDPNDVPLLAEAYGTQFNTYYEMYEAKTGIRKKRVNARDLMYSIMKYRQETGNLYLTFVDNINRQNITGRFVGASNLCQEITVPSRPSTLLSESLITTETGEHHLVETYNAGEIGICNLLSINLEQYIQLSPTERSDFIYRTCRGMDNVLDYQYYPVKEGKHSNVLYRPIGIGVLNYTAAMASKGIRITDPEALDFTDYWFNDLSSNVYFASTRLAKERGTYHNCDKQYVADNLPIDIRNIPEVYNAVLTHGLRFSLHMAIAPTATSGKAINATESIEPIVDLFYLEEGTVTLPTLAYKLQQYREFYVNAYKVSNKQLINLAAIRQRKIDQSQSINLYYLKPTSAKELTQDTFYAMEQGLKTLYYLKTPKGIISEECESCT